MPCHARHAPHCTHISSEWGPAKRHRNFHFNLVLQIWNPRNNKAHRTRSAAAAHSETPRGPTPRQAQQCREPQANLHALALDQIIAIIIQHLQDRVDPNATPSTRGRLICRPSAYVCIGTQPARSDDSDPHAI
ncbi:uncharacterized protein TrAFT101_000944 [Trichoderma asperellum]|uniref:uncharacterized protein n=1 Tax=Trichoderma asperellum TaxID=101201 RepID=UPI00332FE064|nr:hypothetical protein TrAFT101_000944 [Trichoderma asperellum]